MFLHEIGTHQEVKMKPFLSCLFLAILVQQAAAVRPAEEPRRCVIHLNKPFYVSGEAVWYKIYFPISFKGRNIAARVGVWDQNGQMLSAVFHKTHGQSFVQGYYQIPFDLKPAVYHLVVSGTDQASKVPVVLAEALIPIFNDLQDDSPTVSEQAGEREAGKQEPAHLPGNSLKVSIELSSDAVHRREKVEARIRIQDEKGRPAPAGLSISVRDYSLTDNPLPEQKNIVKGKVLEPDIELSLDSMISIRGNISDSLGRALNLEVLGLYSSKEQVLSYLKSNADGRFFFSFPDFYGRKPIQFIDYQYNDIKVDILSEVELKEKGALSYTPEVLAYLNASRQRKKIFQLFNGFEYALVQEPPAFDVHPLDPDDIYLIQNYERFESFPRFFTEVTTALKFKEEGPGHFVAKMFNSESGNRGFYSGKPLFILDGKLTWDANFIAGLDIAQVEEVGLFNSRKKLRQRFSALGLHGGVATIKTSRPGPIVPPSDEEDIFLIDGLQPQADFPGQPPTGEAIAPHSPFLQPQLYWNPDLRTDGRGELVLDFIQSDDVSIFCIEIVAQGQDGAWGYGRVFYRVYP